ncbi:type II toxin-antitoxin system HigB family toxin [Photorhabdus tasmaniensis]
MRVISRIPFIEAQKRFPNERDAIQGVYLLLKSLNVKTPLELKQYFPSIDRFKYRDRWWCIDIGGNNVRLLAFIEFSMGHCYIKHIVSHTEYDKLTDYYRRNRT